MLPLTVYVGPKLEVGPKPEEDPKIPNFQSPGRITGDPTSQVS